MKKQKFLKSVALVGTPDLLNAITPPVTHNDQVSVVFKESDISIHGWDGSTWTQIYTKVQDDVQFKFANTYQKYYIKSNTNAPQSVYVSFFSSDDIASSKPQLAGLTRETRLYDIEQVPIYRVDDAEKLLTILSDGKLAWLGANESYVVETETVQIGIGGSGGGTGGSGTGDGTGTGGSGEPPAPQPTEKNLFTITEVLDVDGAAITGGRTGDSLSVTIKGQILVAGIDIKIDGTSVANNGDGTWQYSETISSTKTFSFKAVDPTDSTYIEEEKATVSLIADNLSNVLAPQTQTPDVDPQSPPATYVDTDGNIVVTNSHYVIDNTKAPGLFPTGDDKFTMTISIKIEPSSPSIFNLFRFGTTAIGNSTIRLNKDEKKVELMNAAFQSVYGKNSNPITLIDLQATDINFNDGVERRFTFVFDRSWSVTGTAWNSGNAVSKYGSWRVYGFFGEAGEGKTIYGSDKYHYAPKGTTFIGDLLVNQVVVGFSDTTAKTSFTLKEFGVLRGIDLTKEQIEYSIINNSDLITAFSNVQAERTTVPVSEGNLITLPSDSTTNITDFGTPFAFDYGFQLDGTNAKLFPRGLRYSIHESYARHNPGKTIALGVSLGFDFPVDQWSVVASNFSQGWANNIWKGWGLFVKKDINDKVKFVLSYASSLGTASFQTIVETVISTPTSNSLLKTLNPTQTIVSDNFDLGDGNFSILLKHAPSTTYRGESNFDVFINDFASPAISVIYANLNYGTHFGAYQDGALWDTANTGVWDYGIATTDQANRLILGGAKRSTGNDPVEYSNTIGNKRGFVGHFSFLKMFYGLTDATMDSQLYAEMQDIFQLIDVPSITITNPPEDNFVHNDGFIDLIGEYSNLETLTINGIPVSLLENGTWSQNQFTLKTDENVSIEEAVTTVDLYGISNCGLEISKSIKIYADVTTPVLSLEYNGENIESGSTITLFVGENPPIPKVDDGVTPVIADVLVVNQIGQSTTVTYTAVDSGGNEAVPFVVTYQFVAWEVQHLEEQATLASGAKIDAVGNLYTTTTQSSLEQTATRQYSTRQTLYLWANLKQAYAESLIVNSNGTRIRIGNSSNVKTTIWTPKGTSFTVFNDVVGTAERISYNQVNKWFNIIVSWVDEVDSNGNTMKEIRLWIDGKRIFIGPVGATTTLKATETAAALANISLGSSAWLLDGLTITNDFIDDATALERFDLYKPVTLRLASDQSYISDIPYALQNSDFSSKYTLWDVDNTPVTIDVDESIIGYFDYDIGDENDHTLSGLICEQPETQHLEELGDLTLAYKSENVLAIPSNTTSKYTWLNTPENSEGNFPLAGDFLDQAKGFPGQTISFWIRVPGGTQAYSHANVRILENYDESGNLFTGVDALNINMQIGAIDSIGYSHDYMLSFKPIGATKSAPAYPIYLGRNSQEQEWKHFIFTYDATTGNVTCFVDGVSHRIWTGAWNGTTYSYNVGLMQEYNRTTPKTLRIGRPSSGGNSWDGAFLLDGVTYLPYHIKPEMVQNLKDSYAPTTDITVECETNFEINSDTYLLKGITKAGYKVYVNNTHVATADSKGEWSTTLNLVLGDVNEFTISSSNADGTVVSRNTIDLSIENLNQDVTSPVITLTRLYDGAVINSGETIRIDPNSDFYSQYSISAIDNISVDLTSQIVWSQPLDTSSEGAQAYTLTSTDAAGNSSQFSFTLNVAYYTLPSETSIDYSGAFLTNATDGEITTIDENNVVDSGHGGWVDLINNPEHNITSDRTISFWIKPDVNGIITTPNNFSSVIVSKMNNDTKLNGWFITVSGAPSTRSNLITTEVQNNRYITVLFNDSSNDINNNDYMHFIPPVPILEQVATHITMQAKKVGTTWYARVFINGVLCTQGNGNLNANTIDADGWIQSFGAPDSNNTRGVRIGGIYSNHSNDAITSFDGKIGDLRFIDSVDFEISQALYNLGTTIP